MLNTKRFVLALTLAYVLTVSLCSVVTNGSEPDAEEQTITGVVKDKAGNPISGAQVAALPMSNRYVLTDSEGRFEISWKRIWEPRGSLCLMARHVKLELAALVDITHQRRTINIELESALALTGIVKDPNNEPMPGVKMNISLIKGWGCGTPVKDVTTDNKGRYDFRVLPQNQEYGIGANAEGYLRKIIRTDQTDLKKEISEVEPIVLEPGNISISGIVTDTDGKPVVGAEVRALGGRQYHNIDTQTDTQGKFKLKLKLRNPYESNEGIIYLISRHRERNLAATIEFNETAAKHNIKLIPGVTLSGKVVDIEGRGIPNTKLSLSFWVTGIGYECREATRIDAKGNFEIRAIPLDQGYSVTATAEGYGRRYTRVKKSDELDKVELEPLVLDIANLSSSGIVVDEAGQPVPDVRIYMYGNGQPNRRTSTDAEGKFTLQNICSGPINIEVNNRGSRKLRGSVQAEGGTTDIKVVVVGYDSSGRRVPKRVPSLVNKTLPDLNNIKINLADNQVKDKVMFFCFFDMEQRPSRYCINQLAKQTKQLKEKGVTVVAVQASKIDENKLKDWVKKYNIPFAVGTIKADIEKTRFTWGVQSLPWLILTDNKHIVRSEGFNINKLSEEFLKEIK